MSPVDWEIATIIADVPPVSTAACAAACTPTLSEDVNDFAGEPPVPPNSVSPCLPAPSTRAIEKVSFGLTCSWAILLSPPCSSGAGLSSAGCSALLTSGLPSRSTTAC
jgi:hypothetical protein